MKPLLVLVLALPAWSESVAITVLHTNDLHAHVEPVEWNGKTYGGYARHVSAIRRLTAENPDTLVLSGGDTFQGTLYFHLFEGLADLAFLNLMGYDGMAVGNHEFDRGSRALGAFVRDAEFPVLAANLDVSGDPELAGLVRPHAVVTVAGRRIGLVGAVTPDLPTISNPGPGVRMRDLESSVAASIAALEADGVRIVILVSHLGYDLEQDLASRVGGIDLVVGGHSHTLLGDVELEAGLGESAGPYPTVKTDPRGDRTLIVSAWQWGLVLGRIRVVFDDDGRVEDWSEAGPILIDERIEEDQDAARLARAFGRPIEAYRTRVVTRASGILEGAHEVVRSRESALGNLLADAMLEAAKEAGAQLAFLNAGGVRRSLAPGPVTYADVLEVQPFGNTLVVLELSGREVRAALEHGVAAWESGGGGFLQVSRGFAYAFDPGRSRAGEERIVEATLDGRPIDPDSTYRVVVPSFLAKGGDGFTVLAGTKGARIDTGVIDAEATTTYLEGIEALAPAIEGRIRRVE